MYLITRTWFNCYEGYNDDSTKLLGYVNNDKSAAKHICNEATKLSLTAGTGIYPDDTTACEWSVFEYHRVSVHQAIKAVKKLPAINDAWRAYALDENKPKEQLIHEADEFKQPVHLDKVYKGIPGLDDHTDIVLGKPKYFASHLQSPEEIKHNYGE